MIDESALRRLLADLVAEYTTSDGLTLTQPLGAGRCRVGRGSDGSYILTAPASDGFGVELANLVYMPRIDLRVQDRDGNEWEETCGLIRATPESQTAIDVLLRVFAHLVNRLDSSPDPDIVGDEVDALRGLFAGLSSSPMRAEIGLWGELFVIAQSVDIVSIAEAWGADANSIFDFSDADSRLEVKTTLGPSRRHSFSLAQLVGANSLSVAVASIVTTEVASGVATFELLAEVDRRLRHRPDLRQAILKRVVASIGADLDLQRRFDINQAMATCRLYDFDAVPRPAVMQGVIDLRWTVEMPLVQDNLGPPMGNSLVQSFSG